VRAHSNPPVHFWSVSVTATMVAAVLCCQGGCVATKYKLAKKNTPPVQVLTIAFPSSAPLQPTLAAVIIYGGPGSWKREALWDEYVLTLQNSGEQAVTVDSTTLMDSDGMDVAAGVDPWALEKRSKALEKQYRSNGLTFVRTAGPAVLIVGAGAGRCRGYDCIGFRIGCCCGSGPGRGSRAAGLLRQRLGHQPPQQESGHGRVHASTTTAALNAHTGRDADRERVLSDGARAPISRSSLVERNRYRRSHIATRFSARPARAGSTSRRRDLAASRTANAFANRKMKKNPHCG
jgi:hypothetical protein